MRKYEGEGINKIKWADVASALPGRLGKQARERWYNHLDPNLSKSFWLPHEDDKLRELQKSLGNRWSEIAKQIPGRSENSVKNRWNSHLRKEAKDCRDCEVHREVERRLQKDGPVAQVDSCSVPTTSPVVASAASKPAPELQKDIVGKQTVKVELTLAQSQKVPVAECVSIAEPVSGKRTFEAVQREDQIQLMTKKPKFSERPIVVNVGRSSERAGSPTHRDEAEDSCVASLLMIGGSPTGGSLNTKHSLQTPPAPGSIITCNNQSFSSASSVSEVEKHRGYCMSDECCAAATLHRVEVQLQSMLAERVHDSGGQQERLRELLLMVRTASGLNAVKTI